MTKQNNSKIQLEDVLKYVPYTTHKLVTPLLFEVNYYETWHKYNREQMLNHFEHKYILKTEYLKSRYNIKIE
jgi:hypothetical protein